MFRFPKQLAAKAILLVGLAAALGAGTVAFVATLGVAVDAFTSGPYLRDGELEGLQAEVAPLIERLRQHGPVRGRYPGTLESIGEKTPTSRFGRWSYRCYREGQAFSLRLGDYGKNGFVLLWDSPGGDW